MIAVTVLSGDIFNQIFSMVSPFPAISPDTLAARFPGLMAIPNITAPPASTPVEMKMRRVHFFMMIAFG
jgi:hypothetical protein